jgi:ElaB/YqjD/DUF883 family membrane-anchored ribosome-binding protein
MANEDASGQRRSSSSTAAEITAKTSAAQRTELETLRRQVSELTAQVQGHLSESAAASLKRAGDAASEMMSGVSAKSREAVEGVREVKDNLTGAIDASLEKRPYTTLAMAFALGLLIARLS